MEGELRMRRSVLGLIDRDFVFSGSIKDGDGADDVLCGETSFSAERGDHISARAAWLDKNQSVLRWKDSYWGVLKPDVVTWRGFVPSCHDCDQTRGLSCDEGVSCGKGIRHD
jgi:hypothetical protein